MSPGKCLTDGGGGDSGVAYSEWLSMCAATAPLPMPPLTKPCLVNTFHLVAPPLTGQLVVSL
jgi:hypothetical protein